MNKMSMKILSLMVVMTSSIILLTYSSYQVQVYGAEYIGKYFKFEYPDAWELVEKTPRFDPLMVSVSDNQSDTSPNSSDFLIYKTHIQTPQEYSINRDDIDILDDAKDRLDSIIDENEFTNDFEIIEPVNLTTIGGKEAAVFLITEKDKWQSRDDRIASQQWTVIIKEKDGLKQYLLIFTAGVNIFYSEETIKVRNQIINSIQFLK